jgi:hypothetical protein
MSGFPAGLPVRIAVRIDFADGSQHEHEVRTSDAVAAVEGFFPEGVVTADVAARMRYDIQREHDKRAAVAEARVAERERACEIARQYLDGNVWREFADHIGVRDD